MNLDECVAALPRIEKGILRDIFSPIPSCPEPYTIDLTLEYARYSSQIDTQSSSVPTKQPQQQQQQGNQNNNSTSDGRFNCNVCKKSFGSEATWNSHQMSAKHIAAVKDLTKKNKSGGSKGGSGQKNTNNNNNNVKHTQKVQEDQDPQEVIEALASFRKAEKVAKENPGMAASVLWKIAKALWSYRQSLETAKVLSLLIRILCELQSTAGTSSTTTSAASVPGSLSPTQISMTLYLSRLAIARLLVYQSPSLSLKIYTDAIQGRWQMEYLDLQTINEMVGVFSAPEILDHCRHFLSTHPKTEKLMVTPAPISEPPVAGKKPADPNLKLLTILSECASLVAQENSTPSSKQPQKLAMKEKRESGEMALVYLALAAVLTEASGDKPGMAVILRKMAVIYKQLKMKHLASSCLIYAGEIVLSVRESDQDNVAVNCKRDQDLEWDLFQALLLAMETGDFVRMRIAIGLLSDCCNTTKYQDVETIITVANAVITQDNDYLYNGASCALDHLLLLVQHKREESIENDLLLSLYTTMTTSVETLSRVRQLVI
ncbi:hypothetical protein BGZ76_000326 [Entomortierella beljakovae]|nr:hypothetical protein BGZ76_000326 [Entomortierella beljakovae]